MNFSVITPSYNQGEFIEHTIESVLIQKGVTFEYVVFDGASSDQTVDILNRYTASYGGVMRWTSEKDRGQTDAVNKGIENTSGEIIAWLNSDDIYYPGTLRVVEEYFLAHPDVDVVYGAADHIDADGHPIDAYPVEPWNFERMLETCIICQPAAFFRRRVIDTYGPLNVNLRYCMDYEFWLRLGAAGVKFAQIEHKLSGSRMHADNKTIGSRRAVHAEINDMLREKFKQVPDRWLFNYAHIIAEETFDRAKHPRLFVYTFGLLSVLAALRWNRNVSPDMRRKVAEWRVSI